MIFVIFLLSISDFGLRHVSVIVSDILNVGGSKDDALELRDSRFELTPKKSLNNLWLFSYSIYHQVL